MIELERKKNEKWIFQKNVSSKHLIESYVKVLNSTRSIDKEKIKRKLKEENAYCGRSSNGSISTMGVRFSQMCFYMFGYKSSQDTFIPTQTTINLINKTNAANKNMLVNLFSIQFPHPYSKTPTSFRIFAGRLIVKLLTEERIEKKLYIDEITWFLPFIKSIDEKSYNELVESILEYRKLPFAQKEELFSSVDNYDSLFANCFHEINYYFIRIFAGFNVFKIVEDKRHNNMKLFAFKHGNTSTYRTDSCFPGKKNSGYIELESELLEASLALLRKFSPFDSPITLGDKCVYSKKDWILDLYEVELIKYLSVIFPDYVKQRDVINSISAMTYMSKYSAVDGKDFEKSLKPVFELFREVLNVDIIGGAGDTDILCAVENPRENNLIYKINVDGKSRKSAFNINPARLKRHIKLHSSKYCIVVAPRFSKGTLLDIEGYPIVTITADALARYCSKECLSASDYLADFGSIDNIIQNNLGKDISYDIDKLIITKYGIQI